MRAFAVLTVLLALAACGPLPHPFEPDTPDPLAAELQAIRPVYVTVDGSPETAERMVKALAAEDIAASATTLPEGAFRLEGRTDGAGTSWLLSDPAGKPIHAFRQAACCETADPMDHAVRLAQAAHQVAATLRGEDPGTPAAEAPARKRVALRPVKVPRRIDGTAFTQSMARALIQRGLAVSADRPAVVVEGVMTVTPQSDGRDLVKLRWEVKTAKGDFLGAVSQGAPVEAGVMVGDLGSLGRRIASAGADGVAEVIAKRLKQP